MPLDQLTAYLPFAAVTAGVVLILWGQKDRLKSLMTGLRPAPDADASMSPVERFETFHALRTWCEKAGYAGAVKALDSQVLPTIVRGNVANEGGSTP